ncbi:hypothetical protein D0267_10780 [Vibrio alginolyticus]|uniref:Uncharacterized protein n=1 Tax=Vibrio alginolyticus TaxID=663 RepID=A0A7Y4B267_VIBAL|nr:hypothetical protein [Vibrio alginolyticus]EGR2323182.1 hypothetical protein [Vibrio alginolyticus]EGR2607738.1 hypothetical protein [Vibrio alginolyticus]NOI09197.1 hypothetical protein [Vibrio alginolyticus]TKF05969.1 hypothetical protein FCV48_19745 [Vibrio alginolyticus]
MEKRVASGSTLRIERSSYQSPKTYCYFSLSAVQAIVTWTSTACN